MLVQLDITRRLFVVPFDCQPSTLGRFVETKRLRNSRSVATASTKASSLHRRGLRSNRLFPEEREQLLDHPLGTLFGYPVTAVLDNTSADVGCHTAP